MHSAVFTRVRCLLTLSICGLLATACGAGSDGAPSADGQAATEQPQAPGVPAAPTQTPVGDVTPAPVGAAQAQAARFHHGINLAGGEFGNVIPGVEGIDYRWPTTAEIDYFLAKGFNTFRIGFKWERMQHAQNAPLDAAYFAKLDALVKYATSKGANVILNPHNFARYEGELIGSPAVPNASFANFWSQMARQYATNRLVIFNLVNEPHDIPAEQWVAAANAATAAIRAAGATNELHVPGTAWTGAHSWSDTSYGTPNAVAMLGIVDPLNNYRIEVHQYLDENSGGASDQCVSTTIGSERMRGFISWLRAYHKTGYLGEFGGGNNPTCDAAVHDMLQTVQAASDVMSGWSWWAAGPAWTPGYGFSVEPESGVDKPQMKVLAPFLAGP
jgi:endoglucanase